MSQKGSTAGEPTPGEVRAALARIVASDVFRSSPQLAAFLSFVVDAVLEGTDDRIKGYTIGVEVLKRSKDFDPQLDPIVRVEATRLRRALDRYYSGPGADGLVRIELVRGSYVPSFSYQEPRLRRPLPLVPATAGKVAPGNGMPTLLVQPFSVLGIPGMQADTSAALHDKFCDAFARFDTVNIVSGVGDTVGSSAGFNYQLMGSVEYRENETANVRFRLIDTSDGTVVWSRVFERLTTTGGRAAAEDAIVTELAATLLQPFGVIRAHERVRHLATDAGDPRYRSIVEASESFRSFDPAQHARARAGLEHLTSIDPSFAAGFSYLAAIYFREFQYGYAGQKGDHAMLDRALDMARKAIELKPESSRAYQILFGVLFARHELAAAFAAGDKAIALNRYDTTVMSDYGGRLIITGEVERGMALLHRAAEFGIVRPSWHHFYMFLGSYLSDDLIGTVHHASQITNDDYELGLVARALASAAAGDPDRAARSIERLTTVNAAWGSNPRGELEKFFPSAELRDRLARDLAKAGLAATSHAA
jgi:tetratricopeptide (TPR) repeat protein